MSNYCQLCQGATVLWSIEEKVPVIFNYFKDFLIAFFFLDFVSTLFGSPNSSPFLQCPIYVLELTLSIIFMQDLSSEVTLF